MSKLTGLYTSMLRAAGLVADAEGFVSLNNQMYTGTPNTPALINGKRIVLPTEFHQRNPSPNVIIFHPLREQAQRGESETTSKLRNAIAIRLDFTLKALMNEMIELAKNRGQHKTLNPDQAVALMSVKDVTESTHQAFSELLTRGHDNPDLEKAFVTIYVKKSAVINERNYFRAGIVSFPMYEELKNTDKPLGMAISGKERQNLLRLMEYMLPGIEVPHSYDRGSNSGVAPHMDALLKAFEGVASRLNDHIDTFNDVFSHQGLRIDDEWVEPMKDLDALQPSIQFIPQQPGNEGTSLAAGSPASAGAPTQNPHPQAQQPHAAATGSVSFDALMSKSSHAPAPVQPVYAPPQNPYPHLSNYPGMPQMVPGYGMVPQHVMQQMMQQQMQQHQQMQNPNAPRGNWAMPAQMGMNPQQGRGMMMGGVWMPYS